MAPLPGWLSNLVWTGAGLISLALGALYFFQDNLLYYPSIPGVPKSPRDNPQGYRSPSEHRVTDFEELFIETKDGAVLHAWLMLQRSPESTGTIIYFHGNAGNMGLRLPHGTNLFRTTKCNVLLVDYRGYGLGEGKPSEAGLVLDAEAALETLKGHAKVDRRKLILYGKSLGGAVALALAERHPGDIRAIVLENTFLSIPAMVDVLMPLVKHVKGLILRIGWRSDERIQRVTQPMLLISGLQDELVPPSHMARLKALATKASKVVLYAVPDGTHNDTMFKGGLSYYRKFAEFVNEVLEGGSQSSSSGDGSCTMEDVSEGDKAAIPSMPVFT